MGRLGGIPGTHLREMISYSRVAAVGRNGEWGTIRRSNSVGIKHRALPFCRARSGMVALYCPSDEKGFIHPASHPFLLSCRIPSSRAPSNFLSRFASAKGVAAASTAAAAAAAAVLLLHNVTTVLRPG